MLAKKEGCRRDSGRMVYIPIYISRLVPVGEKTSSYVHDAHGSREQNPCSSRINGRRACRLRMSQWDRSR